MSSLAFLRVKNPPQRRRVRKEKHLEYPKTFAAFAPLRQVLAL
jgi:hypothetical protein